MLPLVVTVETRDGQVRRFAFADSPISIGRSPFSDLQLTETFVSRWEGTLRFDEREITYFSLGSTNPTFVDGRQVASGEDITLTTENVVVLGELTLRFSREPVPETNLRRKGKRKPVAEGQETALKTAYLEGPRVPQGAPGATPRSSSPPPPTNEVADGSAARPSMLARGDVRLLGGVTVLGVGAARHDTAQGATRPQPSVSNMPPSPSFDPPYVEMRRSELPLSAPSPSAFSSESTADRPMAGLYADYRASWRNLLMRLSSELEQMPHDQRSQYAERVQHEHPQTAREPEFRALLKRYGLPLRRAEVPEVGEWLSDIARDVLPPRMNLDTGLTLDRILGLLETLTQSLGEINDAQDTVRQRWLGRQARHSVLRSENGRSILAYLLNPQANWNDRLMELEQTIRQVVTHELALFQATMEGARLLLQSISPEAIAKNEGVDFDPSDQEAMTPGLWERFRSKDSRDTRLWRGFVKSHEALLDSNRYQRVFLGRVFARTYLAAMGQQEAEKK